MLHRNARAMLMLVFGIVLISTASTALVGQEVTLPHGGILKGVETTWLNKTVHLYRGVRFAKPPTGDLRFKKPVELPPWTGKISAEKVGKKCPQPGTIVLSAGEPLALNDLDQPTIDMDEDCLFLDITVPAGTASRDKKAVMVFIHGGGYTQDSIRAYIGAPLATHGDVIVVAIQYRLGILGFLSDGPGTGNFGLWDQRAALLWVKENIVAFGGDPDMVTIFGESAGAGSVSAQTLSPHNNGLFRRAITQSGTLFMIFQTTGEKYAQLRKSVREQTKCESSVQSVYECLKGLTGQQIANSINLDNIMLVPTPDEDFFAENITLERYDLNQRFDIMSGNNGQEGGLNYEIEFAAIAGSMGHNASLGAPIHLTRHYLAFKCGQLLTPMSVEMCADFFMRLYRMSNLTDDRERARKIVDFATDTTYIIGSLRQLMSRANLTDKSTYGYFFNENLITLSSLNPMWTMPDWLKRSADHGDELFFLFGAAWLRTGLEKGQIWADMLNNGWLIGQYLLGDQHEQINTEYIRLSELMMTFWTNFAKSGNPNIPVALPAGTPSWPQYDADDVRGDLMELSTITTGTRKIPNSRIIEKIIDVIQPARALQREADQPNTVIAKEGC